MSSGFLLSENKLIIVFICPNGIGFDINKVYLVPPSSLIWTVLKLRCPPAIVLTPGSGAGLKLTRTPNVSANLCSIYLDIYRWSPIATPSQGPIWYSHCKNRLWCNYIGLDKSIYCWMLNLIFYGIFMCNIKIYLKQMSLLLLEKTAIYRI